MKIREIKKELKKHSSEKRKKSNQWFFKTVKGEYGEGDKFIGLSMLDLRKIARKIGNFSDIDLEKFFCSKIHEERMLALIYLTNNFKKGDEKQKRVILKKYLKNINFVNNWDLVDISAPCIMGESLILKFLKRKDFDILIKSNSLWKRRIAIISTFALIRQNNFSLTLKYAKLLLSDKEDLIHKAVGWMLREVWKKNNDGAQKCEAFLRQNYSKIPRTTLRYAIERMEEKKRIKFLKGNF